MAKVKTHGRLLTKEDHARLESEERVLSVWRDDKFGEMMIYTTKEMAESVYGEGAYETLHLRKEIATTLHALRDRGKVFTTKRKGKTYWVPMESVFDE